MWWKMPGKMQMVKGKHVQLKKIDIDVEDIKTNDNKLSNECILEIRLFVYMW